MKNKSHFGELTSGREIAPNLYFASPDELPQLLETGEYLDFTDYKNACAELELSSRNASPAFRATALYLGRNLSHAEFWDLSESLIWYSSNPNQGIRDQLLIGMQWASDTVRQHERGEVEPEFSPRGWLIMGAAIHGVVEISR